MKRRAQVAQFAGFGKGRYQALTFAQVRDEPYHGSFNHHDICLLKYGSGLCAICVAAAVASE